jgi:lipopolysaccharide export LptBFGC system permease protein LptF
MLQNKIYQNYFIEIVKTFLIVVFGLSMIALTVRAVNFLELIVDNGYPLITYFKFSFLNLFGIAPKFIPLAFLVSILIFITKHKDDNEFIILWTSGVKKIQIINLIFLSSISILVFYLFLSTFLTPYALNKSRNLLSKDQLNSFLPTVRSKQFSDSFENFTFIVSKKIDSKVENIFIHDTGKNLSNISTSSSDSDSTTIVAQKGVIKNRNIFLVNGQVVSSKDDKINVVTFEQLSIDLKNLSTSTIKQPKLQEISTLKLLDCFFNNSDKNEICNSQNTKKEIIVNLIRRLALPFYIPAISILCGFLLVKNNSYFLDKFYIYLSSFLLLLFTELTIRYTGISSSLRIIYIFLPFAIISLSYFILIHKFNRGSNTNE